MRNSINLTAGVVTHPGEAERVPGSEHLVRHLSNVLVRVYPTETQPERSLILNLTALRPEGLGEIHLPHRGTDTSIDIDHVENDDVTVHVSFQHESQWTTRLKPELARLLRASSVHYEHLLPNAGFIRRSGLEQEPDGRGEESATSVGAGVYSPSTVPDEPRYSTMAAAPAEDQDSGEKNGRGLPEGMMDRFIVILEHLDAPDGSSYPLKP